MNVLRLSRAVILLASVVAVLSYEPLTSIAVHSFSYSPYFGMTPGVSWLTVQAGSSNSTVITITSWSGFTGTVYLSAQREGSNLGHEGLVSAEMVPSVVNLASGASTTSILKVNATKDTLGSLLVPLTVQGVGGGETTQVYANVNMQGPDIGLSDPSDLVTVAPGQNATIRLDVVLAGNITATVTFSGGIPESGITIFPNRHELFLSPQNAIQNVTIIVHVANGTPAGEYEGTILGQANVIFPDHSGAGISRTASVFVNVECTNGRPWPMCAQPSSQPSSSAFGSLLSSLAALLGVASIMSTVVAVLAILSVRRKSRERLPKSSVERPAS